MAQVLPLKVGPRPLPFSSVPETGTGFTKRRKPWLYNDTSFAFSVGYGNPAPGAPLRGPGSFCASAANDSIENASHGATLFAFPLFILFIGKKKRRHRIFARMPASLVVSLSYGVTEKITPLFLVPPYLVVP